MKQVANDGFWVSEAQGLSQVFVVPAEGSLIKVRPGEVVSLHGEVRLGATKRHNNADLNPKSDNATPDVYAYTVRPAW